MRTYHAISDVAIDRLFQKHGFVYAPIDSADVVVFPGGNDLHWSYYADRPDPNVHYWLNEEADEKEVTAYYLCKPTALKVGICKGLQLLHVMNKGLLNPEIDKEHQTYRRHEVIDIYNSKFLVNNVHHQAIIPNKGCSVLARCNIGGVPEAAIYPETNCFGVQFHPEAYNPTPESILWFFKQIARM